jgi:peptidoglycan/LPS O-acetylase OafA/YrhL
MVGGGGEPSQGGRGRLETVQAIRAIAALLVATTHGMGESLKAVTPPGHSLLSVCVDRGQFGVDLFFVVSGFILAHISYAQLSKPAYAKHFIIRRIARVVPVYWFYLTMMIGITRPCHRSCTQRMT